jgi:hypothetical protein
VRDRHCPQTASRLFRDRYRSWSRDSLRGWLPVIGRWPFWEGHALRALATEKGASDSHRDRQAQLGRGLPRAGQKALGRCGFGEWAVRQGI